MITYNLIIKEFGKIKSAVIKKAPLTLFVGDNNSGKSYLLSLLWALNSLNDESVLFNNFSVKDIKKYDEIYNKLLTFISNDSQKEYEQKFNSEGFVIITNDLLKKNKNLFVNSIFNYNNMSIGCLELQFEENFSFKLKKKRDTSNITSYYLNDKLIAGFSEGINDINFVITITIQIIMIWLITGRSNIFVKKVVYLPAARTGFMLAKDVINKVSRKATYDIINNDKNINEIQPFTKPIMSFLDTLEDLSIDSKNDYGKLVDWIQESMTHGSIQFNAINNKEIRYVPTGNENSLPLRTSSAVVTELAPLILILKYSSKFDLLCYEEPEMCLHPQLQQEMAKLLIKLIHKNIQVIATTHSDIIIQHINNMCKMNSLNNPSNLMKEFDLTEDDIIDIKNVAVYQLVDNGDFSTVSKIEPSKDGFSVPTFSNALFKILNQTSEIQEFDDTQED